MKILPFVEVDHGAPGDLQRERIAHFVERVARTPTGRPII